MAKVQINNIQDKCNNLAKLQDNLTIAQTTLSHKNEMIDSQCKQLEKTQREHTLIVSELAVLKSKITGEDSNRKSGKKRLVCA